MNTAAEPPAGIFQNESSRIREFLKKNSRGMNIREISEALQINRNSVAKYLDVLTTREEVEFKVFGKSKVYFLSQHVPVSKLIGFSSHLMVILNWDLHVVQINDAFLRYLNAPRESVIGTGMEEICSDLLRNESIRAWCADALRGNEITDEIPIPVEGSLQHFRVVLTPTRFPDNSPGIILFFENITEKKQIKSALLQSEENFRTMIDESGDGCVIVGEDGTISGWNPAMEEISGIPAGEAIGSNLVTVICGLLPPENRSDRYIGHIQTGLSSVIRKKHVPLVQMPDEIRIIRRGGEHRYIQKLAFPLRLGNKNHVGVIIRDITGPKDAEDLLRKSEEKYRRIVETANEGIWVMDKNFITTFVNRKLTRLLGYTADEMIGRNIAEFMHPDELGDNAVRMNYRRAGIKEAYERHILKKDGSSCWLMVSVTPMNGPDGTFEGSFAMLTDMTGRREAERILKESEERFEQVANNADEWIWEVDADGTYRYCSAAVERILGYAPDEIVEKVHFYDLFPPEVREELRQSVLGAFGRREPFRRLINSALHKNGSTVILETSGTPVYDSRGRFTGYRGCDTDITGRQNLELARQAAQEQIEKNIGQLAMLGDQIRNPLAVILGHTCQYPDEVAAIIERQVREIDLIVSQVDRGWIESERVRSFLRKYSDITLSEQPALGTLPCPGPVPIRKS